MKGNLIIHRTTDKNIQNQQFISTDYILITYLSIRKDKKNYHLKSGLKKRIEFNFCKVIKTII